MKDMAKSRILTDIYQEILPHLLGTFRDSYSTSVCEITQTAHLSTVSPKGTRSLTCFLLLQARKRPVGWDLRPLHPAFPSTLSLKASLNIRKYLRAEPILHSSTSTT